VVIDGSMTTTVREAQTVIRAADRVLY
jgi:hypothetical protein